MAFEKRPIKVTLIVTSVNELINIDKFRQNLESEKYDIKLIVIDEGESCLRKKNEKILRDIPHAFYGPKEREEWFRQRFGSKYEEYLSVIPNKCHAENSFGLLVAYEEGTDVVLELDDDVFPFEGYSLLDDHFSNLFSQGGVTVYSTNKWYNPMENLKLNTKTHIFPRGYPYTQEVRDHHYSWRNEEGECVLNMGLWAGYPDLDALTIIYYSGLDGRGNIRCNGMKRDKIIVGKGTYFTICSMNTSFLPKIIPAFYQLYMNFMGIDRFDDIWSGLFIKRIADHLGDRICLGRPMIYHNKTPRNPFDDLKKELEGIIINEKLWRVIDEVSLSGSSYADAYLSLIEHLEKNLRKIATNSHQAKFLAIQLDKMLKWLRIIDAID